MHELSYSSFCVFSVEVQHHDLEGGGVVSWVESVTLKMGHLTVHLGQGGMVTVSLFMS